MRLSTEVVWKRLFFFITGWGAREREREREREVDLFIAPLIFAFISCALTRDQTDLENL